MPSLLRRRSPGTYNLKDDIGETKNLVASAPKKAAAMKAQLDAMLESHNAAIPTKVPAKPTRPARKKRAKAKQPAKAKRP